MTSRSYLSSDVSAPTLDSNPGSLISLLDACLVNGYGAKPGLGWSKVFSDTNIAVYRAPTGNRMYLRIDDTVGITARAVFYESMTSVNSGVNATPSNLTLSGGLYIRKSTGSASGWLVTGNDKCFYLMPEVASTTWVSSPSSNSSGGQFFFGEFISYRPNDMYNTAIIGATVATVGYGNFAQVGVSIAPATGHLGHYVARSFMQTHPSIPCYLCSTHWVPIVSSNNVVGNFGGPLAGYVVNYPDPVSNKITMGRLMIVERLNQSISTLQFVSMTNPMARGYLPGIWAPLQNGFTHGDTFNGAGGKSFIIANAYSRNNGDTATLTGKVFFETSDTW